MVAQGGTEGRRSDEEWLRVVREATGIPELQSSKLTIENGLLTKLNLSSNNEITSVPESIGQLTSLTKLYLSGNQLTSVPESIGQLTSLTYLDLSDNKLQGRVPQWLGELVNLKYLDLSGNLGLGGSLPSLTASDIRTGGTKISTAVQVRVKPLGHGCMGIMDRLFIVGHVLAGYFDLVTDVLSIIEQPLPHGHQHRLPALQHRRGCGA